MEKKRCWILRPIAWGLTMVAVFLVDVAGYLIFLLCERLVYLLSGFSTIWIIISTLLFGSTFLGLVGYSVILIPATFVHVLDKIYPSNHAFRYYFTGIIEILVSVLVIGSGLLGVSMADNMLWIYLRYGYLIIAMIVFMVYGHKNAEERHAITE